MCVEHVETRFVFPVGMVEFENAALSLALGDEIDSPQRRRQRRSLVEIVEEIRMQVERVDRVRTRSR